MIQRFEFAAVIRHHAEKIPALIESVCAQVIDTNDGRRKACVVASANAFLKQRLRSETTDAPFPHGSRTVESCFAPARVRRSLVAI